MRLFLIVRRPLGDEKSEIPPVKIAETARKLRELAEAELGVEIVVDYVRTNGDEGS